MPDAVINTVSSIFKGADAHDWQMVQQALAASVLLDYSSLSGSPAAILPSGEIVTAWKSFLPGFDKTHHQLSNFTVTQHNDHATVHFDGHASHFIGGGCWTVEGWYDAELEETGGAWRVTKLRFSLRQQGGNTQLPALAIKVMNDRE